MSSAVPAVSVRSLARYRRFPGEPALSFFRRERNSLCAYPREVTADAGANSATVQALEDEQLDLALDRLERKLEMTARITRDVEERGPPAVTAARHEVPSQRRQRAARKRINAEKGRKLMAILKFILHIKGK